MKILPWAALLILLPGALSGQQQSEVQYRDPAEMDAVQRQEVYRAQAEYQECMRRYVQDEVQDSAQPLELADLAMKACTSVLEQLHHSVIAQGYSPQVAMGFTQRISSRVARSVLADVLRVLAVRGDVPGAEAAPDTAAPGPVSPPAAGPQ